MEIKSIRIRRIDDPDGDLSYLGSFSDNPTGKYPDDITVQHSEGGRGFKYFHASNCSNEEEAEQNYRRMLDCGVTWSMSGVRAEAVIRVNDTLQTISSGGLWGLESDSDEPYLTEVAEEELSQLQAILEELAGGSVIMPEAANE